MKKYCWSIFKMKWWNDNNIYNNNNRKNGLAIIFLISIINNLFNNF